MISNSARLLLILVAVYFVGILDHGLWAPMDTVGAGMIWGMRDAGSWVVPLLNGQPYLEKPPLMHWTALVLMSATGQSNEALVRMPSAIYGLGAVLIVYRWGRREHNELFQPDGWPLCPELFSWGGRTSSRDCFYQGFCSSAIKNSWQFLG